MKCTKTERNKNTTLSYETRLPQFFIPTQWQYAD